MPSVPPRLWRDADFRLLWAGQTASQFGEHAGLIILPLIAVLTLHADPGQLGTLRAVGQAPILLLSLLAGAWVDRWRTTTVMMLADLGRAVALAGVVVAVLLGSLGLPLLLVVAFAVGSLSVFFDVAYQASLVRLVRRDQLAEGNSLIEGSRSAAQFGGPALGGALVSLLCAPIAAASGALLFLLSFLTIARIRRPETIPDHPAAPATIPDRAADPERAASLGTIPDRAAGPETVPDRVAGPRGTDERAGRRVPQVIGQIRDGVRFVVRDPCLRTAGLASAAFQFSFAATMTVYLLFLTRELHLSGAAVGLALAATGPGALVGSVLAARLPSRFGYGVVLVTAAAVGDGVLLLVPAVHGPSAVALPVLIAVNFVFATFGQLVNVTIMVIRQAVTPAGLQGRAAATITFAGMGLTPFGSLLGGLLAQQCGLRTGLLVAAAGMMLSPLLMALSPLARLGRNLPGSRDSP